MNFDTFFNIIESKKVVLNFQFRRTEGKGYLLNNEALFQLPLISLIVLLMAKDRRKPPVSEIGQLVGECLEASMIGFKGSAQHIGWSANLRVRTVKAVSFLERAELIEIQSRKGSIQISELGKKVIGLAMNRDDNLSYNLSEIARSYRNLCVSRQLDLELE